MFIKIRSKNETADPLRKRIDCGRDKVVLRLGSTTPNEAIFSGPANQKVYEINKPIGATISGDKLKMKKAFLQAGLWEVTAPYLPLKNVSAILDSKNPTAPFYPVDEGEKLIGRYPSIIKHRNSSRGNGIYFIRDEESLVSFLRRKNDEELNGYIIEKYFTYTKEYRLHVTRNGCFYACRKMLKRDTPEGDRFHRHEDNSVWILEDNPIFERPAEWDVIVDACIKAMKSVQLDLCAVDVKVSKDNNGKSKFIILETNSAPSLGEIGTQKYIEILYNYKNIVD